MTFPIWKYPVHWLAAGGGAGLVPVAPGTAGAAVGVAVFWLLADLSPAVYIGVVALLFAAGVGVCGQTARDYNAADPGFIVYDEIVGLLVAMCLLPRTWGWIAAGFALFRLFDIWKPWPIHLVEHKFGLGAGIMADDVLAGLYALAVLHAVKWLLERLA